MGSNYTIAAILHAYYKLTKGEADLGVPITALFDVLPPTVHPAEVLEILAEAYAAGHARLLNSGDTVPPRVQIHLHSFHIRHFSYQPWTPTILGVPRHVLFIDPSQGIWNQFCRWFSDEKPTRASTAKIGQAKQEPKREYAPPPPPRSAPAPAATDGDLEALAAKHYQKMTGLGLPSWLQGVTSFEEARKRFHQLATQLHPDRESQPQMKKVLTRAFQNFMDDWETAKEHPRFPAQRRAAS